MFPKYPEFRILTPDDKDIYNIFYHKLTKPNSDYCFSVIFSWLDLDEDVEVSQISDEFIILKYIDVLDENSKQLYFAPIGGGPLSEAELKVLKELKQKHKDSKLILTETTKEESDLSTNTGSTEKDEDLCDYVYSVEGYANLDSPEYRRVRREISIFNRDYNTKLQLREVDPTHRAVTNSHHMWDDTFKYNNDPDRLEGLAMARIIDRAPNLDLRCVLCVVDQNPEGFLLFTISTASDGTKYADLHHARFSYRHKYINDYAFHKFAEFLKEEGVKFINFERDAGILGLREHKKLLKPVQMIDAYELKFKTN